MHCQGVTVPLYHPCSKWVLKYLWKEEKNRERGNEVRMRESQGVQESKEASSHLVLHSLDFSVKKTKCMTDLS